MRLGFGARGASGPRAAESGAGGRSTSGRRCLECGTEAARADVTFCRRCGLSFGSAPRPDAELPACHICYLTVDEDGRIASRAGRGRLDLVAHILEHDRYPVGDDEYLESLREGDRIRIGRHHAPFDLVRRYLVTGTVDAGRRRTLQHNAVVTAMKQLARWGDQPSIVGDQAEWAEARAAVTRLMERYHRGVTR
jgi:hypothetical protein